MQLAKERALLFIPAVLLAGIALAPVAQAHEQAHEQALEPMQAEPVNGSQVRHVQEDLARRVFAATANNEAEKSGGRRDYTAFVCHRNIFNLLDRFARAGVDISRSRVLYLVGERSETGSFALLQPKDPRPSSSGYRRKWSFHVVLEMDGYVYDLDAGKDPKPEETDGYFKHMWPTTNLWARSIPGEEYLREYQVKYSEDWRFYLYRSDDLYPVEKL